MKPPLPRKIGLLIALAVLLPPATILAQETWDTSTWHFNPEIRLAGMARVRGENFVQMSIECGNGGAPVISLGPVARPETGPGPAKIDLVFDIDGVRRIHEVFKCYPEEDSCSSTTFDPADLVSALKEGKHFGVWRGEELLFDFTLTGSSKAIDSLNNCRGG